MSELAVIIALFGVGFYLLVLFNDPGYREPDPDEIVEADSPQEAFHRCRYRTGDKFDSDHEIAHVKVTLLGHGRFGVYYTIMPKDVGPLGAFPLRDWMEL